MTLAASVGALALAGCTEDDGTGTSSGGGTTGTGGSGGTTTGTGGSGGNVTTGGGGSGGSGGSAVGGAMPEDTSVVFLHHSTGGVIWNGGVDTALEALNTANGTSYSITAPAYPDTPYPWANYPYDYWYLWVDGGGQADQGDWVGVPTLTSFTDVHQVVVFKHCFPVSGIGPDSGSPDISSSTKSIENYELQYNALKEHLHTFTDNRFIVWTGAALVEAASSADKGQRARDFFTWVKEVWDEPGDNIYVWDFFELETEGGNFLLDQYAEAPGNSHPSEAFAQTVAPLFAQRVVDVIEGRGDIGSITGQ